MGKKSKGRREVTDRCTTMIDAVKAVHRGIKCGDRHDKARRGIEIGEARSEKKCI
jgi:hypothetical protein